MIEGLMALSLVLMGIYFVKSTDLPKEMKERSAQISRETVAPTTAKKKMAFPTQTTVTTVKKNSSQSLIELHNKAIDELTLKITTLEQELKVNNARNAEIQREIDAHLESLRLLNEKINALA